MRAFPRHGLVAAALFAAPLTAQQSLPFPLDVSTVDPITADVSFVPRQETIQILADYQDVVLEDVRLPGGELVDLDLTRISVERRGFRFYVDGVPRADLLDNLDLTLWKGVVIGNPASEVRLSFSSYGSQGWIRHGGALVHLVSRPDADGSWVHGDVLAVTDASLTSRGMQLGEFCALEDLYQSTEEQLHPVPTGAPAPEAGSSCATREGRISVETDYQLFQVWNDLSAMTSYITTLLSFVSDRYEGQVNTVLTYPYMQFYTTPADPWVSQDGGGGCGDVLNEFQAAWAGNIPNGGHIGHFLSGANLGCGVAWLDVLCNDTFNFSVSGNINGNAGFPIQQQPNNWDFIVVAHELGHNFSTPHTHDFCPPLDECPSMQYWGQCQTQQVCSSSGTVMSYCHLCSGGTGNITTFFHPEAVNLMAAASSSCLPLLTSIDGDAAELWPESMSTTVTAQVVGAPVGEVQVMARYAGSGAFSPISMMDLGGGSYTADLPAPDCSDAPEFYFQFTDATCGLVTDPAGAPGVTYSASVGTLNPFFTDDFETDMGWTLVNLGATTGDWDRGIPVNDPGWAYDPAADFDGSGSAYLTENAIGNTDVDNGATELTSPVIDMTGGNIVIGYAYYLTLTNDDGVDRLLVEIDENGGAGPWTEIARHDTDGGSNWRTHAISSAALTTAGVTPTATMVMRFTVNDDGQASIVEAGLDAFEVSFLTCSSMIGTNFCTSAPNSTGMPALLSASGSRSVSANALVLQSAQVPANENGIFYYGPNEASIPFGNGTRCVDGAILFRLPVETSDVNGDLTHTLDITSPPYGPGQIFAGATWKFQAWFRDNMAGPGQFDFSDGLSVTFTP